MDALDKARREIDTVDAALAALFERRMAAVLAVAEYKKAHGLPIFDAAREAVVLDKAEARIQNPALRPYYRDHVQHMMDVAKQYEAEVLGRNRAAYQGVEGAFAHIALKLGGERFYEYIQKFGILEKTGIDLTGESKGVFFDKALVTNTDKWGTASLTSGSFG